MSDPFDTQEMQDALQDDNEQLQDDEDEAAAQATWKNQMLRNGLSASAAVSATSKSSAAYPTLLRYPVAETRNKNCWSEPPVTIFSVRGPQYFSDKKKQTSAPYLLSARGTDIFLFEKAPVPLLPERYVRFRDGRTRQSVSRSWEKDTTKA